MVTATPSVSDDNVKPVKSLPIPDSAAAEQEQEVSWFSLFCCSERGKPTKEESPSAHTEESLPGLAVTENTINERASIISSSTTKDGLNSEAGAASTVPGSTVGEHQFEINSGGGNLLVAPERTDGSSAVSALPLGEGTQDSKESSDFDESDDSTLLMGETQKSMSQAEEFVENSLAEIRSRSDPYIVGASSDFVASQGDDGSIVVDIPAEDVMSSDAAEISAPEQTTPKPSMSQPDVESKDVN